MKFFSFNKNPRYEQHDNENINYYSFSSSKPDVKRKLSEDLKTDICIIGGGFTGICSALYLSKKGFKVTLLEARKVGWGASGRNGGQLGGGLRKEQKIIEKKLGFDHALELWKLGIEAVEEVKKNIKIYNIDCDIQNGVLTAGYYKDDKNFFLDEIEYMLKRYEYDKYLYLSDSEIKEEIKTKKYFSGLLNKGSYHIHPLKYLYGLVKELIKLNVEIYENTPVNKIVDSTNGVKIITKNNNIIKADYAVVGCNGYLDNLLGNLRNKFMPINNYVLATEPLGRDLATQLIKNNYAVCDTRFIIDYYRLSKDWRMIFGGGETYTAKFLKYPISHVTERMYKVFPELKDYKIDFCWGGTLAITVNRLPTFGTIEKDKIIYAHGYSGHGVGLTTLAGKLIAEKISGNSDRFNFFASIPHITIPGGDLLRRPAYSLGVAYYKFLDSIH
tara:strand:+ start:591 stop:1919 length:1329 start_codon:yes stop_codon:yes gene_type:complete